MKVVLIGSGNVATHLGKALKSAGHTILQVWSRNIQNAHELAELLNAKAISSLALLSDAADIYIISVSDDAIPSIAAAFPFSNKLLVHTSGTTGIEVLQRASQRTGVFYPLQTFSKQRPVNFQKIPVAVEGCTAEIESDLKRLAESISENVVVFDSEKRKALHVAAVFACNFTNHLYTLSKEILGASHLNFELIRPLIEETAKKVQNFYPDEVQTGPAVRNDLAIVNKHLEFLKGKPELQALYRDLSQNIINFYQKP